MPSWDDEASGGLAALDWLGRDSGLGIRLATRMSQLLAEALAAVRRAKERRPE